MPDTTTNLGLRKPEGTDPFAVWQDIGNLADDVDTAIGSRGKCVIATEESRTNAAFGLMTTPDRVQNVVLPADGLLFVAYQAAWKEAVTYAARAALFLGTDQLRVTTYEGPETQAAAINSSGAADYWCPLTSFPLGLASVTPAFDTSVLAAVTTGQAIGICSANGSLKYNVGTTARSSTSSTANGMDVGGACAIYAAAGTYDVSVRFSASSGAVTVKNRKLWVWTQPF